MCVKAANMGPRDVCGPPSPPPPAYTTKSSGTVTPDGMVVLVDVASVPPPPVPSPTATRVHVTLADGSCYCSSATDDGDSSNSSGTGSVWTNFSDGCRGCRSSIGNITLANSTAQIGSVMNYITVLVPDEAAATKTGGDRDLAGVALQAATLAAKEKLSCLHPNEDKELPSSLTASQTLAMRRHLRWPCVAVPIALLAAILLVYFMVLIQHQSEDAVPGPVTLPNGVTLAGREVWHALPPRKKMPRLFTPVKYVVVHHTATDHCFHLEHCANMVRAFQQYHQDALGRDWDDIGYNYLVGGDGVVYEGRGWDWVGGHFELTEWGNKTMNIALIGNFVNAVPPAFQRDQLRKFIAWGVEMGKIRRDYQLMGACQIKDTQSPGLRFMDDLRTWTHWWNFVEKPTYCTQ